MKKLLLSTLGLLLFGCGSYTAEVADDSDCIPKQAVTFRGLQQVYIDDPKQQFSTVKLPKEQHFLCSDCMEGERNGYKMITITAPAPYYTTGVIKTVGADNGNHGSRFYQVKIGERYFWASYYDFSKASVEALGIVESYRSFACPQK